MEQLFTLLGLGLELQEAYNVNLCSFCEMSQEDWKQMRMMADKQGVSAIVLDGLNSLVLKYGRDKVAPELDFLWWQQYVLEWAGVMSQTEMRNQQQMEVMEDMTSRWNDGGCQVMVFKGQTSGKMYPNPLHRCPGDIDCYLFENYVKGNDIAQAAGAKVNENWYKHSVISYLGETFENHQYFVHTRDGKRGKVLEKELETGLSGCGGSGVLTPPTQWLSMFLTYHACAHFLSEGLRLKQLLDWAMFLQRFQNEVDWKAFYSFCERFKLKRFADAVTAICVKNLGVKVRSCDICAESPFAERILKSMLYDDDYVFGSGKSGWCNRWHLVKNLFHYRWKYEKIYQESVWKQMWYYASGYLFKTEC